MRLVVVYLHVVGAVVWIGGLAYQAHVLLPAARRGAIAPFADAARRARPVTWTAIGVVGLTGFYNVTQLGDLARVMARGAALRLAGMSSLGSRAAGGAGPRDFAQLTLLNAALTSGGDPTKALRAITRLDRVVLLLALVAIYLGLAISRR